MVSDPIYFALTFPELVQCRSWMNYSSQMKLSLNNFTHEYWHLSDMEMEFELTRLLPACMFDSDSQLLTKQSDNPYDRTSAKQEKSTISAYILPPFCIVMPGIFFEQRSPCIIILD